MSPLWRARCGLCGTACAEIPDEFYVLKPTLKQDYQLIVQRRLGSKEFAEFLVEQGIDSMLLNPDADLKTTFRVLELES